MTDHIDISGELRQQRDQYEKYRETILRRLKAAPGSDLKFATKEDLVKVDRAIASINEALKMPQRREQTPKRYQVRG